MIVKSVNHSCLSSQVCLSPSHSRIVWDYISFSFRQFHHLIHSSRKKSFAFNHKLLGNRDARAHLSSEVADDAVRQEKQKHKSNSSICCPIIYGPIYTLFESLLFSRQYNIKRPVWLSFLISSRTRQEGSRVNGTCHSLVTIFLFHSMTKQTQETRVWFGLVAENLTKSNKNPTIMT